VHRDSFEKGCTDTSSPRSFSITTPPRRTESTTRGRGHARIVIVPGGCYDSTVPRFTPLPLRRLRDPFDDLDWLFELKYDGFRALAYLHDQRAELVSRNGNRFNQFAGLAAELRACHVCGRRFSTARWSASIVMGARSSTSYSSVAERRCSSRSISSQ